MQLALFIIVLIIAAPLLVFASPVIIYVVPIIAAGLALGLLADEIRHDPRELRH